LSRQTLGTLAGTTDFESVPFDHSGTSPHVKFAFKCLCLIKRILKCNAKSIGFVRVYWLGLDAGQVTAVSMRLGVKYQYRLVISRMKRPVYPTMVLNRRPLMPTVCSKCDVERRLVICIRSWATVYAYGYLYNLKESLFLCEIRMFRPLFGINAFLES
jgi:hypothetical protein